MKEEGQILRRWVESEVEKGDCSEKTSRLGCGRAGKECVSMLELGVFRGVRRQRVGPGNCDNARISPPQ